jgi:hypothetical protein
VIKCDQNVENNTRYIPENRDKKIVSCFDGLRKIDSQLMMYSWQRHTTLSRRSNITIRVTQLNNVGTSGKMKSICIGVNAADVSQ